MESFIWHHVNEKEKEQIKAEAKTILSKFAKAMSKIKEEKYEHFEQENGMREETKTTQDPIFREIFFQNAPKKNKNFILGERKKW